MKAWCITFRTSDPVDPARPVLVPGDPEREAHARRVVSGIPVKLGVLAQLLEVSRDAGVPPLVEKGAVDLTGVRTVKVVL